jgi:hypothetical protein
MVYCDFSISWTWNSIAKFIINGSDVQLNFIFWKRQFKANKGSIFGNWCLMPLDRSNEVVMSNITSTIRAADTVIRLQFFLVKRFVKVEMIILFPYPYLIPGNKLTFCFHVIHTVHNNSLLCFLRIKGIFFIIKIASVLFISISSVYDHNIQEHFKSFSIMCL